MNAFHLIEILLDSILFKLVQEGFWCFYLEEKVSFHRKFQQLILLFIYFSHLKIWKILGCDRLPPLKEISSRDLGRLEVTSWLQGN